MNIPHRIVRPGIFIALLRMILGGVFIVASYDKIADPSTFAASIVNYRIIAPTPALLAATFLPWIELLSGLGLLLGVFVRGSSLLVLTMMVLFTAIVAYAMARGLDISCGCFSQDPASGKIGWMKISENCTLMAMSFIVFRRPLSGPSLGAYVRTCMQSSRAKLV